MRSEAHEAAPDDDAVRALQERLGPKLEEATAQLQDLNEKVKTYVKKNPGTCLMGALALGFVVGRLASRK